MPNILVVYDNEEFLPRLARKIRAAGHEPVVFSRGDPAVQAAIGGEFGLILLDYKLKEDQGRTASYYVPLFQDACRVPIVIFTGLDDGTTERIPGVAGWIHYETSARWWNEKFPSLLTKFLQGAEA